MKQNTQENEILHLEYQLGNFPECKGKNDERTNKKCTCCIKEIREIECMKEKK